MARIFVFIIVSLLFFSCSNNSAKEAINDSASELSPECKIFLEDYQYEVANYLKIQTQITTAGEDINLIIARNSAEESIVSMQSDPGLFKCISSPVFKMAIDSLNTLMD
jgi:hypothetical protein